MRACRSADHSKRPWRLQRRRAHRDRSLEITYGKPPFQTRSESPERHNDEKDVSSGLDYEVLRIANMEMAQGGQGAIADAETGGGSPVDELEMWQLHRDMEVSSTKARNAERRANVFRSFIQRQSDWLSRWAQEMRQQAYASAQDGNRPEVLSIAWQRWDEFSNGVAEQAQHALHMLRRDDADSESGLEIETQANPQIETLLAAYEIESTRLLKELGNISGEETTLIDTVVEKPVSLAGRRWGVGPSALRENDGGSDPVMTVAHGWLKNDDLRLHRRIISEQHLIVERLQQLCLKQLATIESWAKKCSVAEEQTATAKWESADAKTHLKRVQKMLKERMLKIEDLHKDVEVSSAKIKEQSLALKQCDKDIEVLNDMLLPWQMQKAATKIQRRLRERAGVILQAQQEAVAVRLQAAARGYLTRKKLGKIHHVSDQQHAERGSGQVADLNLPGFSFGAIAGSGAAAVAAWRKNGAQEEIPILDRLLDALQEIQELESECVIDQDLTQSQGLGTGSTSGSKAQIELESTRQELIAARAEAVSYQEALKMAMPEQDAAKAEAQFYRDALKATESEQSAARQRELQEAAASARSMRNGLSEWAPIARKPYTQLDVDGDEVSQHHIDQQPLRQSFVLSSDFPNVLEDHTSEVGAASLLADAAVLLAAETFEGAFAAASDSVADARSASDLPRSPDSARSVKVDDLMTAKNAMEEAWERKLQQLRTELVIVRQERDERIAEHQRMQKSLLLREAEVERLRALAKEAETTEAGVGT